MSESQIIVYFLQHGFHFSKNAVDMGLADSKSKFVNFCLKACNYFQDKTDSNDDDEDETSGTGQSAIAKIISNEKEIAKEKKDTLLFTNNDLSNAAIKSIYDITLQSSNGVLALKEDYKFNNLETFCSILELSSTEKSLVKFCFAAQYILTMQHDWRIRYCLNDLITGVSIVDFIANVLGINIEVCREKLNHDSELFLCGVLQLLKKEESEFPFRLNTKIAKILRSNQDTLTADQLLDRLFPNNLLKRLSLDDFHQKKEIKIIQDILHYATTNQDKGINILLWGEAGCGKTELAQLLADGYKVISVGLNSEKEESRSERINDLILAQKIFSKLKDKTIIIFDEMEDIEKIDINAQIRKGFINRILENNSVPIIWTCNHIQMFDKSLLRRMTYNLEFSIPNTAIRKKIWDKLNDREQLDSNLLKSIPIAPSLIFNSLYISKASSLETQDTMEVAANLKSLVDYGKKYYPDYNLGKKINIDFITSTFNEKLLNSIKVKGNLSFSMCFYGPSGTGKSALAKHIADTLNLDTIFKNASDIIDPYIGMTERNIRAAFQESQDTNSLLVFDEVDTFLQERSGAQRSWEVSQVNEFLLCLEKHKSPFIATTNLIKTLDKASLRRFTFKYKFDYVAENKYKEIFEYFFGLQPILEMPSTILSLGDFEVVRKKLQVLDNCSEQEIIDMLVEETTNKLEYREKIGFKA